MQGTVRLIIMWGLIISSGCQTQPVIDPFVEITPSSFPPSNTPGDTQMPPSPPTPGDAALQSLIDKAKKDLARRFSIPAEEIVLVQAESVTWPDSSLGCPQEGMFYAQVLTPGYLIRLASGGQEFEYHASRGTEVVYCQNPMPPVEGTPGDV